MAMVCDPDKCFFQKDMLLYLTENLLNVISLWQSSMSYILEILGNIWCAYLDGYGL